MSKTEMIKKLNESQELQKLTKKITTAEQLRNQVEKLSDYIKEMAIAMKSLTVETSETLESLQATSKEVISRQSSSLNSLETNLGLISKKIQKSKKRRLGLIWTVVIGMLITILSTFMILQKWEKTIVIRERENFKSWIHQTLTLLKEKEKEAIQKETIKYLQERYILKEKKTSKGKLKR